MVLRRLLCLALLLASAAVPAQEVLRHALIIGVSTYADPRVPVLEGVTHDMLSAREIALAMGVPESQITVLRDHEATKRNIVVHLERLGQRAGDGSRVLVYFSGHGTRWHDPSAGGCVEGLLTYDSQAIVNREFAALARPLSEKADKVILMFDACHSGGVGTMQSPNRSWPGGNSGMRPKFFVKADEAPTSCNRPTNVRNRSLLGNSINQLPENVVQITSSRSDEISFDEADKGGLATQALRACMLGGARDLDGSGAITLSEIEVCAQDFVREKVKPWPELLPHHVSVRGLRNLIPVPVALAPATQASPPATVPTLTADVARIERERLLREQAARSERDRLEVQGLAALRDEQLRLEQERLAREQSLAEGRRLADQVRVERLAAEQAAREQLAREADARRREEQERAALAAAALEQERELTVLAAREREARQRELREHEASERQTAALARIESVRAEREAAARTERERRAARAAAEREQIAQQREAKLAREREEHERAVQERQARAAWAAVQAQERREAQARLLESERAAALAQVTQPVAAVAALRDVYDQRSRRHTVDARSSRGRIKIGRDGVELTVTSSQAGYVYVVMLGSDETSFYLLFPNGLDHDNRIQARMPLRLPRPNWKVQAAGPAGTDRLLVMVTEQPRELSALTLAPADAAAPFTYTAADLDGRGRLIDFMIGTGVRKGSARFGATWVNIEETP